MNPLTPRDSAGRPLFAPTWETTDNLDPTWTGYLYTATAGAYSIFDEVVTKEIRIRGGWYALMANNEASIGDYIEFSVVDKDNVLGLFGMYGIPEGGVLELKKYVRKDYVVPSLVGARQIFQVGGAFPVMVGLYLRTGYHSVGETNVNFKTTVLSYE